MLPVTPHSTSPESASEHITSLETGFPKIPVFIGLTRVSGPVVVQPKNEWLPQMLYIRKVDRLKKVLQGERPALLFMACRLNTTERWSFWEVLVSLPLDLALSVFWLPKGGHEWRLDVLPEYLNSISPSEDERFSYYLQSYILDRLNEKSLSVVEMSRAFQMSNTGFYERVKGATGYSPNRLVQELRLGRATELLKQPELAIGDIASVIGIEDVSYFSRLFRKRFGSSPSNWRKNLSS